MLFSHDTEVSLAEAAALVNTVGLDGDTLITVADLDDFLSQHPYSSSMRSSVRPTLGPTCHATTNGTGTST